MKRQLCIRPLRLKAGLTQKDLAARLGYRSSSIVAMWEVGSRQPRSDALPDLADALGCGVEDLYANLTSERG